MSVPHSVPYSAPRFELDTTHVTSQAALFALGELVDEGAPIQTTIDQTDRGIKIAERLRRLSAVAMVDEMQTIDDSRVFLDQGHASARIMVAHLAGISGSDAFRLDRVRRMVNGGRVDAIDASWRRGDLGVEHAVVLAKIYANPRVRDRFVDVQDWFITQATELPFKRFEKRVTRWVELADDDGPTPEPDPSHDRRNGTISQDHFSKAWHLRAQLGSIHGARFNEIWCAYYDAETALDWQAARAELGAETTRDDLPRTDAQRWADALCQMGEDAALNSGPSVRVKRIHNLVWQGEGAEELYRRWFGLTPRPFDPNRPVVTTIDGDTIHDGAAFESLIVGSFRRVVQNPASIALDVSEESRFYTGLTRLGVELQSDECFWPGCHKATTRCQIDHTRPAARGGPTTQVNGVPACVRHNLIKEAGYTVTRLPDGSFHIITPTGELVR